jgi:phage tail-like protein
MSDDRRDPFVGTRFRVEIDGTPGSNALSVALPESRLLRQGDPGSVQYGALVMQRGLTARADWYAWWDAARRSKDPCPRTVTVLLVDAYGAAAWRWIFANSEPIAYRVSGLVALTAEPLVETLELSVRTFEAVGPAA